MDDGALVLTAAAGAWISTPVKICCASGFIKECSELRPYEVEEVTQRILKKKERPVWPVCLSAGYPAERQLSAVLS
uniref:Uncharacterized protein n=1 Tax=Ditylenchus dipsaci TaxID=166011 RepID=A0A915CLZ4_9BILA